MNLGPVTKLYKKNKINFKKIDNDIMLSSFDVIVIILIYGELGANRKPDFGCIFCQTFVFVYSNLL